MKDSAGISVGISNIIETITNKILALFIFLNNGKQEIGQHYLLLLHIKVTSLA